MTKHEHVKHPKRSLICRATNRTYYFLRATACNASRVLAIVETSVRPSVRRILEPYQNGAS